MGKSQNIKGKNSHNGDEKAKNREQYWKHGKSSGADSVKELKKPT